MIVATLQRYALAIALGAAALGWAAAGVQTVRYAWHMEADAKAEGKAQKAAREKEDEWALIYQESTSVKETQLSTLRTDLAAAVADSMRLRTKQRLPKTPASCAGSSPAALAAEDANVALGFAAEFDELRANYADCKVKIEAR